MTATERKPSTITVSEIIYHIFRLLMKSIFVLPKNRMEISFTDAAFGLAAPLVISRLESCGECGGSGAQKGTRPKTCPVCGTLRFLECKHSS